MTNRLCTFCAALLVAFAVSGPRIDAQVPTEKTLLSFSVNNGAYPFGGMVYSSNGSLYGTAFGGGKFGYGVVFELTPPTVGGNWTPAIVHTFNDPATQGSNPYGGLLASPSGSLYGTTTRGGANGLGAAFELAPPLLPGGAWTETLLYSFGSASTDGILPYGGLVMDNDGNLYGTTVSGGAFGLGTVYELQPSGTGWVEIVLHSFAGGADAANPYASLTIRANGTLYGTAPYGGGTGSGAVFALTESAGNWTEAILCSFPGGATGANPYGGVLMGGRSALYGATSNGGSTSAGTIYQCVETEAQTWELNVLYNLTGSASSYGTLVADSTGALYGTAPGSHGNQASDGMVFKLTPPAEQGGAWVESDLYNFPGNLGNGPRAGLVWGPSGGLYGTTVGLGKASAGTVFQLTF
jgi:uncharacterized repeat protein (TIGR03803 family)